MEIVSAGRDMVNIGGIVMDSASLAHKLKTFQNLFIYYY